MTRPDTVEQADPKGLIRESYAIEGISSEECRSIFLDWALNVPVGQDEKALVRRLLAHHGQIAPIHPMTDVMKAALDAAPPARRKGGARARRSS